MGITGSFCSFLVSFHPRDIEDIRSQEHSRLKVIMMNESVWNVESDLLGNTLSPEQGAGGGGGGGGISSLSSWSTYFTAYTYMKQKKLLNLFSDHCSL